MKNAIIAVSLIFFLSAGVNAQKNFLPGMIMPISGDTIKGFIKEIDGRINPTSIEFKSSLSEASKNYSPLELKWFRFIGGDWYFSYVGPLETSSLNTNDLTYDSTMHTVINTLFIRAVVIGRASLYYARDQNDRIHLFLQKFGGDITELVFKKYYVDEIVIADYQNKIVKRAVYENQMYKGQLIRAFQDCPYLAADITSKPLEYAKNDLEILFNSYNHCKGAKIVYQEPKDEGTLVFTLNTGINISNIKFESSTFPSWNDYHFNNSVGFAFGIGCDYLLPRTAGKWGFFNELSLKSFKCNGDLGEDQDVLKLDLLYLKLATMMRYYFTTDRKSARPYFGFGIANNVAIKDENFNYSKNPEGDPIVDYFRTYEQGLIFGFGTYYKRWNGELRYEFSNGISGYTDMKSPAHTAYILLGYKLFEL